MGINEKETNMKLRNTLLAAATIAATLTTPATADEAPALPVPVQNEVNALQHGNTAAPGVKYTNPNAQTNCSLSWAAKDTTTGKPGFLTAGHCGKTGDRAFLTDTNGAQIPLGEFLWSTNSTNDSTTHSIDLAFIAVDNPNAMTARLPGIAKTPTKTMKDTEYRKIMPDLCKVGHKTGTTCGDSENEYDTLQRATFTAASFPGDSGGPVYAQTASGEIVAVGTFVGVPSGVDTVASAQVIDGDAKDIYRYELLTR